MAEKETILTTDGLKKLEQKLEQIGPASGSCRADQTGD